mmetsp:Transcript_891/g.1214  ORF Transcript_891/g.1214 Transcript_891/m.1214 type:complete len:144 (-) Transcript_891:752-1183(-)|eukprot:CAMPEP_0185586490 /NCGR_PEP_ID=MMETSP0434-20130131/44536_1 /TAXON_ID=626734 ORGANISM="Favella taraikaensis, Strain Fe Narragansett Bay" /NCGR_SAMPLE_ID=MMETSP0434 /ASSEMBLY_ACC=CAM_ASM_000379 /LENGTH=143 /DNA_ID=CAMNT_0028207635 /DNA_START=170 /DNA_END=601 /DNA_ORIENTATION=+
MDRGYLDGCYDLCHSGHFNCIRQASDCVDTLILGPNSDEDILRTKGPTVLNDDERAEILRSLKWGHEVVERTPYDPSVEVLDRFNCQYYIHGDDPVICDGVNINELMKNLGRFKEVRRTTGVSTTDLTGKLLKLIETDEDGGS